MPVDADRRAAGRRRSRAAPGGWRSRTTADGVTVVNDAYNANPDSMRAALRALAAMRTHRAHVRGARQMAELGADSIAEHDAIGRLAVRLSSSRTIAVGEGARALYLGAGQEGSWDGEAAGCRTRPPPSRCCASSSRPGDVVLVKASRSVGLEAVAAALLEVRPPMITDRAVGGSSPWRCRCWCTPVLIRVLTRRNLAQAIRESADGIVYPEHSGKKGTPSMGGLAIVVAVVLGYGAGPPGALGAAHGLGAAGALPDGRAGAGRVRRRLPEGLQVAQRRGPRPHQAAGPGRRRAELRRAERAVPGRAGADPGVRRRSRSCARPPWVLPLGLFVLWIWFLVTGITNGVNLTDGLDGLAAGASVLTFGGFTLDRRLAVRPELL